MQSTYKSIDQIIQPSKLKDENSISQEEMSKEDIS